MSPVIVLCKGPVHEVGRPSSGCGFSCTGQDTSTPVDSVSFRVVQTIDPTRIVVSRVTRHTPEGHLSADQVRVLGDIRHADNNTIISACAHGRIQNHTTLVIRQHESEFRWLTDGRFETVQRRGECKWHIRSGQAADYWRRDPNYRIIRTRRTSLLLRVNTYILHFGNGVGLPTSPGGRLK